MAASPLSGSDHVATDPGERPAEAVGPGASGALTYQPGLDGLRALAILSVMIYHAGFWDHRIHWWGGWMGVDLFFVLSGFLITRLLLDEHRKRSAIDLRAFYVRRVLRLYPLIVLVLAFALVALVALPGTSNYRTEPLGIAGIAFYFVNWVSIHDQSNHTMGIWSHLWTLSIEEQFYLVWPACVLVVLWLLRGRRAAVATVALGGATAVALYRARIEWNLLRWQMGNPFAFGLIGSHRVHEWNRWYFGSFTHTDGLLLGAAVAALLPPALRVTGRGARAARDLAGVAALVFGVGLMYREGLTVQPHWLAYWGLAAFNVAAAVAVVAVVLAPVGVLTRVLSWQPLVWVGRRSYGIYVIHPPVYVAVQRGVHHKGGWAVTAAAGATLLLAALSFHFVERPALKLKRRFTRT